MSNLKRQLSEIEDQLEILYHKFPDGSPQIEELEAQANDIAGMIEVQDKADTLANQLDKDVRAISNFKKRMEAKYGSYADWEKWALSQYKIHDNHHVESLCHKWKEPKVWECSTREEAFEKIEQLLSYKEYDHYTRGKDHYWKEFLKKQLEKIDIP